MKIFRTEIHGILIEGRKGDFGGEQVLVDGRVISDRPLSWLGSSSHFFDIHDENDTTWHIEVRWFDRSRWGLGKYLMVVNVNGRERCRVSPADPDRDFELCANCGYRLTGLQVHNGEVQCPECGRHTSAALLPSSHFQGQAPAAE